MTLPMFVDAEPVAQIEAGPDGARITYGDEWLVAPERFPISLTMPLAVQSHGPEVVTPWLMNLLPEGEPLRAMTRALGVAQEDVLGLVAETGKDLAGALSIGALRPGSRPELLRTDTAQLERIIEDLSARPFLVGEEGVSMSLAGAQDKLPVALADGAVAIPVNGAVSTHILKPDNSRLPGSVQNEALCMVLAARCGLMTAPVTTGVVGQRSYLLVERYDRLREGDRLVRLHQEDFCQALGRPPGAKYQRNQTGVPGPSLAEMFALVRRHMTAREITRLLDAVIFNVAIGNVDSHAKNYSLMLSPRLGLAPLYDLMSGLAWPNITQNHAQDIGGQARGRHIYGRHWRRMADVCGLSGPGLIRRVASITGRVSAELETAAGTVAAMPAGPGAMLARFVKAIGERAELVGTHAAIEGPADYEPAQEAEVERRYDA